MDVVVVGAGLGGWPRPSPPTGPGTPSPCWNGPRSSARRAPASGSCPTACGPWTRSVSVARSASAPPPCPRAAGCATATAARCWPSTRPRSRPGPGRRWSWSTAPGCTGCSPPRCPPAPCAPVSRSTTCTTTARPGLLPSTRCSEARGTTVVAHHVAVPRSRTADLVVAADGAGSRLRAALFPDHPGLEGSGEYAARALVRPASASSRCPASCSTTAPATASAPSRWPTAGPTGTRPGRRRAAVPDDPVARLAALRARSADWHPTVGALLAATDPAAVHVTETVRLVAPLPALAVGRVALLGDAAHAMTPDLGQGGCQAFEDAVALGALLDGAGPPTSPPSSPATTRSPAADHGAAAAGPADEPAAPAARAGRAAARRGAAGGAAGPRDARRWPGSSRSTPRSPERGRTRERATRRAGRGTAVRPCAVGARGPAAPPRRRTAPPATTAPRP